MVNKQVLNTPFIQNILHIFALADILATLFIGCYSILSPNVAITINKEPLIIVVVFSCLVIFIILCFKPFIKSIIYNTIRIIIVLFLTAILFYTLYSLFKWSQNTVEGLFNTYLLSAKKTASFEDKIVLYNTITQQFIEKIACTNAPLADYLCKSPTVLSPPSLKIMQTSYQDIIILADQMISLETMKYAKHIENIKHTAKIADSSYSYSKLILISAGTIVVIAISYYLYSSGVGSKLTDLLSKGFNSVVKTQEFNERGVLQARKDNLLNTIADTDLSSLSSAIKKINVGLSQNNNNIDLITIQANIADGHIAHLIHLVNNVIRPSIQVVFRGLEAVDNETASIILHSLTIEQQNFLLGLC